jgi:hypothetical protein
MNTDIAKYKIKKYEEKNKYSSKEKYLNKLAYYKTLSNGMNGGNPENVKLSGPVSAIYYKSANSNKKVIVLGDIHGTRDGRCRDTSNNITDYINNLSTVGIDLFVEKERNIKRESYSHIDDYMTDLFKLSETEHSNIRFHDTDIRGNGLYIGKVQSDYENNINLVQFFSSIDKPQFIDSDQYSETIRAPIFSDLFSALFENFEVINQIADESYDTDKEYNMLSKNLIKEFKQLDKVMQKKLRDVYKTFFENFADRVFGQITKQNIGEIYQSGQLAGAAFTDLYLVSRMLKNTEYVNNIFYVGRHHQQTIDAYLVAVGFNIFKSIQSDAYEVQCIQLYDFDLFFNNGKNIDTNSQEYQLAKNYYKLHRSINQRINKMILQMKEKLLESDKEIDAIDSQLNQIMKTMDKTLQLTTEIRSLDDNYTQFLSEIEKEIGDTTQKFVTDKNQLYNEYNSKLLSINKKIMGQLVTARENLAPIENNLKKN